MARTEEIYELKAEGCQALEAIYVLPKRRKALSLGQELSCLLLPGKTPKKWLPPLAQPREPYTGGANASRIMGLKVYKIARVSGSRRSFPKVIKEVLRLSVECIPQEATHWSVRLMAKAAGIITWQVRQIWDAADLKPRRLKTFKISNDPEFAEKVIDVVGR